MTILKIIFLLLLLLPFAIFLLFIVDKLMDEMPKRSARSDVNMSYTPQERAANRKPGKRKRRKARKQKKKE
ncbi:MAG: hypothetical protein PHS19_06110 [Eubacteriales bacterium]|nr:hypothetical protein [Eubacteriales bacterium]